jgi:dynein heavy chain
LEGYREQSLKFNNLENLFELEQTKYKILQDCKNDIEKLKTLWDLISIVKYSYYSWLQVPWKKLNTAEYVEENERFIQLIKKAPREVKIFKAYPVLVDEANNMKKIINSIISLTGGKLEKRHWEELSKQVGEKIEENSPDFCFNSMVKVNIHKYEAKVQELNEIATKEANIGNVLARIQKSWKEKNFEFESFSLAGEEVKIFKTFVLIQEDLSIDNLKVLSLLSQGKSVEIFKKDLDDIKKKLGIIDETIAVWEKVQKNWKRLVNIFLLSDDIRNQLPDASKLFDQKSNEFREIMRDVQLNPIIIEVCTLERKEELDGIHSAIESCEKKLREYLEQKKKIFPRFYFVSNQTLIDILSNGNNPVKITTEYLGDLFDGLKSLVLAKNKDGVLLPKGEAMYSKDDEVVPFQTPFEPVDAVELWLIQLEYAMRQALQVYAIKAKVEADEYMGGTEVKDEKRMDWIYNYCAQIALMTTQIIWTEDVHKAFDDIDGGMSNAMRDCLKGIEKRINLLISKVRGDLSKGDRAKIITIITIDVHSRDVVAKLVKGSINDKESFLWSSQLKFFMTNDIVDIKQKPRFPWEKDKKVDKAVLRIIDWAKFYSYEYVGNCGRLVITPLTDRCYITLTQALGLIMGGAPAGPAGTGKTETTKDLGRAIGLPVFVFNCSELMSIDSLGQNFMGLAQTGAWGCFDEFNRISIEVLSVVTTQVKSVLDNLRTGEEKFNFMNETEIGLQETVGFFITMNPGYAGRTELPESLKALFRSCAMVVPDLILICENMLMSEGYEEARELSKKFVTLYDLSKSLLSKQRHYDWGLRAVKSVLRQAGKLKRDPANAETKEYPLLMRALRDFNLPKIVTDDRMIFTNLLGDLFKGCQAESIFDEKLKKAVHDVAESNKLIPEDMFCLKCVQLSEILEVRHCVFIIGPPGCGKSTVWKTLLNTYQSQGQDGEIDCLDPKAVTEDELFGVLTKAKEFKNGVLSSIIRNQSKDLGKYKLTQKHKWVILDGDIDPGWIESLNTVMDDNKILTLVSNDRFPMTPAMRLVFEISNLRNATPATVSRAGVLFINDIDIGWKPFFDSWLKSHRKSEIEAITSKNEGMIYRKAAFDSKAESVFMRAFTMFEGPELSKLNRISPFVDIQMIQTTCSIIDELMLEFEKIQASSKGAERKEAEIEAIYNGIFYYASMWGFGGAVTNDPSDDRNYTQEFNNNWKQKGKFPDIQVQGSLVSRSKPIFDFYFDIQNICWKEWTTSEFSLAEEINFLRIFVPTTGTVRLHSIVDLHVRSKKPLMFIGSAGTGKTTVFKQYINSIQSDEGLQTYSTNFSSKTSSASLQEAIMGSGISKLGMKLYGLGSGKTMVFFIDDINMPFVDTYGTQSPIALMRQLIDYGIIYDSNNLDEYNTIQDLYFCACQNPKAGSFTIELRLQRHFSVIALQPPDEMIVKQIYKSILGSFFERFSFDGITNMADRIVEGSYKLFNKILMTGKNFSPTASKFHYQFNLRELAKISEGIMMAAPQNYNGKAFDFVKLWVHECRRIFEDRLILEDDIQVFRFELKEAYKIVAESNFAKEEFEKEAFSDSNIFTSFISVYEVMDDRFYLPIKTMDQLRKCLKDKLAEYNETNVQMDLVLFDQAIEHICRIARIIERPGGNALLVGVGGSGKQSLTKLATYLQQQDLENVKVTANFNVGDFKTVLINIFKKVTKPPSVSRLLLASDTQLYNENVLVFINEMLNSGYVAGIWAQDELNAHLNTLKNEAKLSNFKDTLYMYFVEKIRKNLHICLCMSPVGDNLRIKARKFPGLINQTMINWFHSWPQQALYDVAYNFLSDVEFPESAIDLRVALAENMSETHIKLDEENQRFFLKERRRNYTTPKSFLELIEFYKGFLKENREKIIDKILELKGGLDALAKTHLQVEKLKIILKEISLEVEIKSKEVNEIIVKVNADKAIADEEERKADIEKAKTNEAKISAEEIAKKAFEAFKIAKPALDEAEKALENLSEKDIGEMKSLPQPPPAVYLTGSSILFLLGRKKVDLGEKVDQSVHWQDVKNMLANPKKFKQELFDFANTGAKVIEAKKKDTLNALLKREDFQMKFIRDKSVAAGGLCTFLHNIMKFNEMFCIVAPLDAQSKAANKEKDEKIKELEIVIKKLDEVKARVAKLEKELAASKEEQRVVEEKKQKNLDKMNAAEEMVNGLASNQIRWSEIKLRLEGETFTVIGDSLLAAEFVSYIGPFNSAFRMKLWKDSWISNINKKKIPITEGVIPLEILTTKSTIAKWKNEGLPEDQMSLENASIIIASKRWPLIIDPQLQGGNWINGHVNDDDGATAVKKTDQEDEKQRVQLQRISLNSDRWEGKLEQAIEFGQVVLLEGVKENLSPILDPLLSKSFVKRAGQLYVMVSREEPIHFHKDFQLYLQCKESNPHFKPETSAQCTIINFIVTEGGLEDQLLSLVVDIEKPELERKKIEVMKNMNKYSVDLARYEDQLLTCLSQADPDTILDNVVLIQTLNDTKKFAKEIEIATKEAKETEKKINEERNNYRPVAAEGAMLYFLIISLNAVTHMYQYSLDSFHTFFDKAIQRTSVRGTERISKMVLVIRETIYQWISRGLFEKHKIIFLTMMTFRLMVRGIIKVEYTDKQMMFLITCAPKPGIENPVKDWLPNYAWNCVMRLGDISGFEKLPEGLGNELSARFKEWYSEQNPENVSLPSSWKKLNQEPFKKLLVLRALRPDRMIPSLSKFIREVLPEGDNFVGMDQNLSFAEILESAYIDATQESQLNSPIFFILSPGADPVREVEKLGEKKGFSEKKNNFHSIALGQGQDIVAEAKLNLSYKEGHWIMIQNIHLMPSWMPTLEKLLERFSKEGSANDNFRLFLSAEPSKDIPIGILEKCIKLTNEPPTGLKANMKRAWTYFDANVIEEKDPKIKPVLFCLCYFHSTLLERRKFGPKGWNMFYPFNIGDLRDSVKVLDKNIEGSSGRLPWADFKYIFGEIMYGGHIVDDWDRKLCNAYLEYLMDNELLSEDFELLPFVEDKDISFKTPAIVHFEKYKNHIENLSDNETPLYYGLHPNAEINLGTMQCNYLFETLLVLAPPTDNSGKSEASGDKSYESSYISKVQNDWVLKDKSFNLDEIKDRIPDTDRGPYQNVFLQECEYMNYLIEEICNSLGQLKKAKDGELTYSEKLEKLEICMNLEKVPDSWALLAYPAKRSLATWFDNLLKRIEQLAAWKDEPLNIPRVTKINLLFNPQSFLTAIKQENKKEDLNKLTIRTDFQKKSIEEIETSAKDGAYCYGFLLDGAKWDWNLGIMDEAKPKEMFSVMPVCHCRSEPLREDDKPDPGFYQCPTYRTEMRGGTYIFTAQLRTPPKYIPRKWVLAGVAMLLDVEGPSDEVKAVKEEKK